MLMRMASIARRAACWIGCSLVLLLAWPALAESTEVSPREALIARAAALELDTAYERPPGEALHHHAAGFAKVLCSAIFLTGLEEEFAVENIGYFTAPYAQRKNIVARRVDKAARAVHLTLHDGTVRTAQVFGDQGCVALSEGEHSPSFEPSRNDSMSPRMFSMSIFLGSACGVNLASTL